MVTGRARSVTRSYGMWICAAVAAASCGPAEQEETESRVEKAPLEQRPMTEIASHDHGLQQRMHDMSAVQPDSLMQMVPLHLEEVGAILDEMEPMSLGIQADNAWRSTLDSVQNDLALMRDMRAEELRDFVPDHRRRIERLMLLHDSVTAPER